MSDRGGPPGRDEGSADLGNDAKQSSDRVSLWQRRVAETRGEPPQPVVPLVHPLTARAEALGAPSAASLVFERPRAELLKSPTLTARPGAESRQVTPLYLTDLKVDTSALTGTAGLGLWTPQPLGFPYSPTVPLVPEGPGPAASRRDPPPDRQPFYTHDGGVIWHRGRPAELAIPFWTNRAIEDAEVAPLPDGPRLDVVR